jgi:hypothetical protein
MATYIFTAIRIRDKKKQIFLIYPGVPTFVMETKAVWKQARQEVRQHWFIDR